MKNYLLLLSLSFSLRGMQEEEFDSKKAIETLQAVGKTSSQEALSALVGAVRPALRVQCLSDNGSFPLINAGGRGVIRLGVGYACKLEIDEDGQETLGIYSLTLKEPISRTRFTSWSGGNFLPDDIRSRFVSSCEECARLPVPFRFLDFFARGILEWDVSKEEELISRRLVIQTKVNYYPIKLGEMSAEQIELLMGISVAIRDTLALRRQGINNQRARIHATAEQMSIFYSLPIDMRKRLHYYIVNDSRMVRSVKKRKINEEKF